MSDAHYGRARDDVEEDGEVATDDLGSQEHRGGDWHQEVKGREIGRVVDRLDEERVSRPLTHPPRQTPTDPPIVEQGSVQHDLPHAAAEGSLEESRRRALEVRSLGIAEGNL